MLLLAGMASEKPPPHPKTLNREDAEQRRER